MLLLLLLAKALKKFMYVYRIVNIADFMCVTKEGLACSDLLQVVASSLDTLEPVLLEGFESKEDLVACLKASANVPRIAGEPLQHRWAPPKPNKTSERTAPIIV